MIVNKKILITGGAGFLGRKIIERLSVNNEITVFSRDESKHYFLKKIFPHVRFIIGDVRDLNALKEASKGQQIGIFAASLKQIEAVDQNPYEALQTIVNGAFNSRKVAEEQMESACFISSDKSRAATTIYGGMKFIAGESFIINAEKQNCNLSCAIYGNVLNSTGSVIPLIWDSIKNNYPLYLFGEEMTRFAISSDDAIDLIEKALQVSGYNVIPKLASIKILDLFKIYEKFGLKFKVGQPRISEKLHEIMFSNEEASRVLDNGDHYLMHYRNIVNPLNALEYSSKDNTMPSKELEKLLEKFNFFKP